jgi:hypothetical protein
VFEGLFGPPSHESIRKFVEKLIARKGPMLLGDVCRRVANKFWIESAQKTYNFTVNALRRSEVVSVVPMKRAMVIPKERS